MGKDRLSGAAEACNNRSGALQDTLEAAGDTGRLGRVCMNGEVDCNRHPRLACLRSHSRSAHVACVCGTVVSRDAESTSAEETEGEQVERRGSSIACRAAAEKLAQRFRAPLRRNEALSEPAVRARTRVSTVF